MSAPNASQENASARAIVALVFGILGILMLAPCAGPIVAIVAGTGEPGGVAKAGVILGWITLALYALTAGLILLVAMIGGFAALPFVH